MKQTCSFYIKAVLTSLYLLILPALLFANTPENVSGLVNQTRAKVTAVGADFVVVDDVTGFAIGDTILVIQMKGDAILVSNDGNFGKHDDHVGDVGFYEFIKIKLVEPGPKKISFYNDLKGSYNAESFVQIVRVESYQTLNVTGEITCPPWDSISGTGGVIAIFASDKVILNDNINASGRGFGGGEGGPIDGICLGAVTSIFYFDESTTRAGRKGEGYSSHNSSLSLLDLSLYAKGVGAIGAGGGGGDGSLSGGGGGASYGYGGEGGEEVGCGLPNPGGSGGYILNGFYTNSVIMGGGGGASGYSAGGSSPDGGAGGGIIFIMTDSIYGNNNSIMANGESVTEVSLATAGGGGGGAAGTVVISANGYGLSSGVVLEVKGGNGGDTPNGTGNGGGGSGGLIWVSPADHSSVTFVKSGGLSGNYVGISASDGDAGPAQRTDLAMRLTGFLFNTIVTERDGNLLDSICFGEVPRPMKASVPVGGTLPYTYFWEKGYTESGPWVPLSGTEAGGVFTPDQPETNTLWIRRTIEDSSIPVIVDNSKKVKVIVHPLITSFEIGHDTGDTICFNQDPTVIEPLVPLPGGGNGFYIYKWHNSPDGLSYNQTLLSGMSTYDPAALANTTWYRRTVYSGACVDSTSFVKITVLPSIGSNIVGPSDVICEGELFTDLSGPPVTGGDGVYTYKWEASDNNSTWGYTIEGTTDQPTYNPDENSTDFPSLSPKYFRRVVYSGEDDCCIAISPSVSLTMQPAITNNGLSESFQTVCEKDPVVNEVIGTTPLGGNGIYTYMWQESVSAGPWTDLADSTRKDFSPYSLSLSTTYRRVVYSGVCEDTSTDEFIIVVQPILEGNSIKTTNGAIDTIICFNQDPPLLTSLDMSGGLGAGTYFYLWEDSSSSHDWQPAPLTNSSKNYDPGNLTQSTWYRRIVSSGTCDSISLPFRITVLPLITGNSISASQDICFGTSPDLLTGTSLGQGLGGGDGTTYTFQWQWDTDPGFSSPVDVGTDNPDYQPGNLDVPTYYRRVVTSGLNGCCEDFSNSVDIAINPLPIGVITAGQDESICEDENISLSLTVTAGLAPFNVVLDDGISDLPLMVSSTGPINHSITPNYVSDQSLTYTLVSIADANGCLATAPNMTGNKTVAFWENPVSNAGLDDEWCLANSNTLDATASIGVGTWSWAGASSVFDQINNPKSAVTYSDFVAGDTVVTFKWKEIRTELPRCTDSASVNIRFFKPPSIALAGDDSTLLPFQVDMVLFANDPVYGTGEWTVLSGGGAMKTGNSNLYNGMVQGLSDGLNLLEWRISNGDVCLDSFDEVELTVPEVKLITGFSPNSDGVNDFFVINGLVEWDGGVVPNELVITDMAGVILYQEKDYGNDWDGRDMRGKPLPSGTYYYFINVFYSTKVQLKGFVIIKRD